MKPNMIHCALGVLVLITSSSCGFGDESVDSILSPVFVAGHLGNYEDCPEQGFDHESAKAGAPEQRGEDQEPEPSCADGEECALIVCDPAQATVQLTNTTEERITGISISRVKLLNIYDDVYFPILATTDAQTNATFSGTLAPGKSVTLRIDFQGPRDVEVFRRPDGASPPRHIEIFIRAIDAMESGVNSFPIDPHEQQAT